MKDRLEEHPAEVPAAPGGNMLVPDREFALIQLKQFVDRAGQHYAKNRNLDLGPGHHHHVSRLSPFIRRRILLEEEVLAAAVKNHSQSQADKFIQEVFWRVYFKGWMEQHPQVWQDYRNDVSRLVLGMKRGDIDTNGYELAVNATTGIECFDFWVRELKATGYLHNHARMWFASIWVFTLGLPWQLGADFFYRHLLDGDPASNTLGWRWVSGLHTPGKHYLARAENIAKFTQGRFNPAHQLTEDAAPIVEEERPALHPWQPPDHLPKGSFGLLITEEDCCPENLFADQRPLAVLGLTASESDATLPVSAAVREFSRDAVKSALKRASETYDVPVEHREMQDWAAALRDWCARHRINTVISAYPPVGEVADRLRITTDELTPHGINLRYLVRNLDRLSWPNATSGFFKFKKRIPTLLEQVVK